GVPLVQAAVHRFEGELNLFSSQTPGCLHCLYSGRNPGELEAGGNCAGGPVFAPSVGLLGILQAAEALKVILRGPGATDFAHTRLVNLLDGSVTAIERPAHPGCPVCGQPMTARTPGKPASQNGEPGPNGIVLEPHETAILDSPTMVALLEAGE